MQVFCWGFYGHRKINYLAVFLLPPEMMVLYKKHIAFIEEHAVDPDKRRYAVPDEGPRHYIDIDNYGTYPFPDLPRKYDDAVAKYGEDTIKQNGIVPWHVQVMLGRLTAAFRQKDLPKILKNSAEIGHYISDACVPLHASSNHDGQHTNQKGIHGFWESRLPELFAERDWDFMIGKAQHIDDPLGFIWDRVLESAIATDTVLSFERELNQKHSEGSKFSFEERNGKVIRQYSSSYSKEYNDMMKGMVERRMRMAIYATASYWFTAWINAGQPDLHGLADQKLTEADMKEYEELNRKWLSGGTGYGRPHD